MNFKTYPAGSSPFRRERATYAARRRELQALAGQFAVIRGDEVAGVFPTFEDASAFGYERYGLDPFMVREIERPAPEGRAVPNVTLPADLDAGALIEVAVGLNALRVKLMTGAGQPFARPEVVRARIDTGARLTVIDESLVSRLALPPIGEVELHTPSTGGQPLIRPLYEVALYLAQPRLRPVSESLPVLSADLSRLGVLALIGRDVLSRCVFIYNGPASQFTLAV